MQLQCSCNVVAMFPKCSCNAAAVAASQNAPGMLPKCPAMHLLEKKETKRITFLDEFKGGLHKSTVQLLRSYYYKTTKFTNAKNMCLMYKQVSKFLMINVF